LLAPSGTLLELAIGLQLLLKAVDFVSLFIDGLQVFIHFLVAQVHQGMVDLLNVLVQLFLAEGCVLHLLDAQVHQILSLFQE
jgi:hypothetical protein